MTVKIQEALATMRAYPKDPQAWVTLGAVLANMGDFQKARQCYEHALTLDPGFSRAQTALQALDSLESASPPAPSAPAPTRPPGAKAVPPAPAPEPTSPDPAISQEETMTLATVALTPEPAQEETVTLAAVPAVTAPTAASTSRDAAEPSPEPAAEPEPKAPTPAEDSLYQAVKSYIIPGETLYAAYECADETIDVVGITDQRIIFQHQTLVRQKAHIVSLPYNHILAVASAEGEITLLTALGQFSFVFGNAEKGDWAYRFIMHQLLHQSNPQLPG